MPPPNATGQMVNLRIPPTSRATLQLHSLLAVLPPMPALLKDGALVRRVLPIVEDAPIRLGEQKSVSETSATTVCEFSCDTPTQHAN
jgi:hypothetical protein